MSDGGGLTVAEGTVLKVDLGGGIIVRGTLDTLGVTERRQGRSKYGAKRPK